MTTTAGFKVVHLGADVSPEQFTSTAKEHSADIVAMSALLTTTMGVMRDTVTALGEAGLSDTVKVIIGGAPVTQSYADDVKADGYAPDAASAVERATSLVS